MLRSTYLFLLFFGCLSGIAQTYTIKGVVIGSTDKETIPVCNVYFSGSTIGTMTDENGLFSLSGIQPGSYDLVVSHINYEFRSFPITVSDKDIDLGKVILKEKKVEVTYAKVEDKLDRKWRRNFTRFKKYIFGKHYREKDINIPNAYVAEFLELDGTLVKKESFALEIENKYTGYKVYYPIEEFLLGQGTDQYMVGFPRFTPMESDDPRQQSQWEANRKTSYEGSLRHFFKSLIEEGLEDNFFECHITNDDPLTNADEVAGEYRYRKRVNDWQLPGYLTIEETHDPRIKKVTWKDFLEVKYLKEMGNNGGRQVTYLKARDGHVFVYNNGLLIDPTSVTAFGYLSTEGLYEMLPFDFSVKN